MFFLQLNVSFKYHILSCENFFDKADIQVILFD